MYIFVSTGNFPVSTRKFPVSTLVGVFVGILWCVLHRTSLNLRGHFRGHLRVHSRGHFRALSFLSLFFWKWKGKPPKKQGFFIPTEPLKSLEKKGKTLKKNKEFLARRKNKEFQKNKERKDRVSTFVREFVGQISRFACSVLF